jgi:hypothetical protein
VSLKTGQFLTVIFALLSAQAHAGGLLLNEYGTPSIFMPFEGMSGKLINKNTALSLALLRQYTNTKVTVFMSRSYKVE